MSGDLEEGHKLKKYIKGTLRLKLNLVEFDLLQRSVIRYYKELIK